MFRGWTRPTGSFPRRNWRRKRRVPVIWPFHLIFLRLREPKKVAGFSAVASAKTGGWMRFVRGKPSKNFFMRRTASRISTVKEPGRSALLPWIRVRSLTLLNQKSSGWRWALHSAWTRSGRVLLVANYGGGSVKSFSTGGRWQHRRGRRLHSPHRFSVNPDRQAAAHAHFIHADPSRRFALVCDLGTDQRDGLPLDPTPLEPSGPRLHPPPCRRVRARAIWRSAPMANSPMSSMKWPAR